MQATTMESVTNMKSVLFCLVRSYGKFDNELALLNNAIFAYENRQPCIGTFPVRLLMMFKGMRLLLSAKRLEHAGMV